MLINDLRLYQSIGAVIVMSDIAILTASTRQTLVELAKQASALSLGLQNAMPGDKAGAPNKSVQYLAEIAEYLTAMVVRCDAIVASSHKNNG